jgi:hypothetical protein
VEAARDPCPLVLLGAQRAPAALAALILEPRQHLVEDGDDLRDLGAAAFREPLTGPEQIDSPHPGCEPLDRVERVPEEQEVRREHDDEHERNVEPLDHCAAPRDDEQNGGQHEQRGVDREDPPEKR